MNLNFNTVKNEDNIMLESDLDLSWDSLNESSDEKIDGVLSAGDGLVYSLDKKGCVDIYYISQITGLKKDDIIKELKGSIYLDPQLYKGDIYSGYLLADEYLSGNLLNKLNIARIKNVRTHGLFKDNIDAINAVIPSYIPYGEIYYTLSSPWISIDIKKDFINELLDAYSKDGVCTYIKEVGKWKIDSYYRRSSDIAYGTRFISAGKIIEKILNAKSIEVFDYYEEDGKQKKKINREETLLAEQKEKLIQEKFREYVNDYAIVRNKIVKQYNERYGFNVERKYNGSFLSLPNLNKKYDLFNYQKDAVSRILFNNNTLLAHNVGAGKTYIMIASGEELIRLGKSKKNLYVVPNSIVGQWSTLYKDMYPNSNILTTEATDYSNKSIVKTLTIIKNGNYNAVIMPYSSFDRINLSKAYRIKCLEDRLEELSQSKNRYYLNKTIESIEKSIEKLKNEDDKLAIPEELSFENLGFTRLYLDEAHNYKNISLPTNKTDIRGISSCGSTKCNHMLDVCNYLNSNNFGIIMATGTPITNSVSDIYVFQKYLQNGELNYLDIKNFDNWISMYVEANDEIEIDVDTSNFRVVTRLSKFHNLPELTQILSRVTDFHFDKNSSEIPLFNGYTDILLDKSNELNEYLKDITRRIELIRHHKVKRTEDNMLKVTTDGRLAALDLRLTKNYNSPFYLHAKIYKCAKVVKEIYDRTNSFKGTQLIFSDIGTPKEGFNIYDALKDELVSYGIPSDEIAYIHEAFSDKKRDKLFKDMNDGRVRVLIGSTFKLGIGVNIQDKLYAIHHLDVPWRPADMTQREGRILRRGNTNKEVFIYRYITEGSFDAYSWQILETKQKFINELLSNSLNERSKEDVENTVLSYGEVKALAIGNPKLKEYTDITNRISKLRLLNRKQIEKFSEYKRRLLEIPNKIEKLEEFITKLKSDLAYSRDNSTELSKDDRKFYIDVIYNGLVNNLNNEEEVLLTTYRGFDIYSAYNTDVNNLFLIVSKEGKYNIKLGTSEKGVIIRIDNFIESMPKLLKEKLNELDELKQIEISLKDEINNATDYEEEIINLDVRMKELESEMNI